MATVCVYSVYFGVVRLNVRAAIVTVILILAETEVCSIRIVLADRRLSKRQASAKLVS